jgi:hypothetical protein
MGRSCVSDLQRWPLSHIPVLRGTCTSLCNGRSRTSLCFAAPALPYAMAALAHLTSRDGRSRTSLCFAAPALPCAMEEMQKDCREPSLPCARGMGASLQMKWILRFSALPKRWIGVIGPMLCIRRVVQNPP